MLLTVLIRSLHFYRQYGLAMTRVLMPSFLKMTLWAYVALILIRFSVDAMGYPGTVVRDLVFFMFLSGATVTFFFSLKGLWDFLIYSASLNLNADTLIAENENPHNPQFSSPISLSNALDFITAFHVLKDKHKDTYMGLISWITVIPVLSGIPGLLIITLTHVNSSPGIQAFGLLLGILMLLLGGLFCLLFLLFCTFVFQIVVFEPNLNKPLAIIQRSMGLVRQSIGVILILQVLLWIATNLIIPTPIGWILRLVRLTYPLDILHEWLIQPFQPFIFAALRPYWSAVIGFITDTTIMMSITMLMLPLGIFIFTFFYRKLNEQNS